MRGTFKRLEKLLRSQQVFVNGYVGRGAPRKNEESFHVWCSRFTHFLLFCGDQRRGCHCNGHSRSVPDWNTQRR